jgi:hypothetical protein
MLSILELKDMFDLHLRGVNYLIGTDLFTLFTTYFVVGFGLRSGAGEGFGIGVGVEIDEGEGEGVGIIRFVDLFNPD